MTENNRWVVGTTKRDVELRNLLTFDLASVGDGCSDGVENVVETGVAARSSGGGKKRLGSTRRRISREAVVAAVVGVSRRSAKVGRVEEGVADFVS